MTLGIKAINLACRETLTVREFVDAVAAACGVEDRLVRCMSPCPSEGAHRHTPPPPFFHCLLLHTHTHTHTHTRTHARTFAAACFQRVHETPAAVQYFPSVTGPPVCISRAEQLLQWQPTPLTDAIAHTCSFYAKVGQQ